MPRIIFQGANLLDGDKPARANSTVVVEGETIRSVGQAKLAAQPGDRVIDLDGKTLMPALHCGITGVVSSGANACTIDADLCLAIQDGLIEGPRMLPASRGLDTIGGYTGTAERGGGG